MISRSFLDTFSTAQPEGIRMMFGEASFSARLDNVDKRSVTVEKCRMDDLAGQSVANVCYMLL